MILIHLVQRFLKSWMLVLAVSLSSLSWLSGATYLQFGDSRGTAGSTVTVPLTLSTSDVVSAAQIDLSTDPDIAEIANITGTDAGQNHLVDSELMENGSTRVVVYSNSNEFLFSEVLIDVQLVLRSDVGVNDRSVMVEEVKLSSDTAGFVNTGLIPYATFAGPDSSIVYKMGDSVSATSTAYGTGTDVDRVEFLVDGWSASSDSEPPYEMSFPLEYFGNITISARAFDEEGNWFESGSTVYQVEFPPTLEAWLDVFFSSAEQADSNVGGLEADLDIDGNSTLLEYAMGLHPRRGDGPRESGFFQDPDTGLYHFGFIRPKGVMDLTYTFQVSPDLENWTNANGIINTEVVSLTDVWEQVRFTLDDLQEPREFGRVLIESSK